MTDVPARSRVRADTPALMKPSAIPAADVIPSLTSTTEAGASRPRASRRSFTQLTRVIEPFDPGGGGVRKSRRGLSQIQEGPQDAPDGGQFTRGDRAEAPVEALV